MEKNFNVTLILRCRFHEHDLIFEKNINLPFPPYMGLTLQENGFNFNIINSDREYTSNIIYNLLKCQFTVDVVRVFSSHVPGSIVDDLIKRLTDNNWVRTDDNDITELKKLISTIENKLDDRFYKDTKE